MQMTQNFVDDFRLVLEMLSECRPFCLIRFGDGESAILRDRERPFRSMKQGSTWHQHKIPVDVVESLRQSLQADVEGLYVATICPACSEQSSKPLRDEVRCPLERQTYAEIFGNANWEILKGRLRELREQVIFVSSAPSADIRIPTNLPELGMGVHQDLVHELHRCRGPIALAAGPSACILGHLYWTAQEPARRVPCVDVGALFDPLDWGLTRHYMPEGSPRGRRVCTWDGHGLGLDTD